MKLFLLIIIVFIQYAGFAQNRVPSEADAVSAVKKYVQRMQTGAVSEAVNEFWDLDYFFSAALGLTYLDMATAEKRATREAFSDFVAAPFASTNLLSFFKTLEVRTANATNASDSLLAVTLELTGDSGRYNATNTMLLTRIGGAWKIIDLRQNALPSMRATVVMLWAEERRSAKDSIATVYGRAADEVRRKAASQ